MIGTSEVIQAPRPRSALMLEAWPSSKKQENKGEQNDATSAIATSEKRRSGKRPRSGAEADDVEAELSGIDMRDTVASARLLAARLHPVGGVFSTALPLILQHQLYTVLHDRSAVDAELDDLRRQNAVRLLRLQTVRGDTGVITTAAYKDRIAQALASPSMCRDAATREALQQLYRLVDTFPQMSVTRHEIMSALREHGGSKRTRALVGVSESSGGARSMGDSTDTSADGESSEEDHQHQGPPGSMKSRGVHQPRGARSSQQPLKQDPIDRSIGKLVALGFLVPRRDGNNAQEVFWFSAPEIGRVSSSLPKGRKVILAALKRSRYKELLERNIRCLEFKGTELSPDFHIADLVGLGDVIKFGTASGPMIKVGNTQR